MHSSKGLQPLRSVSKSFSALPAAYAGAQVASRRYAGTIANFKIPTINNEANVSRLASGHILEPQSLINNYSNTTPKVPWTDKGFKMLLQHSRSVAQSKSL